VAGEQDFLTTESQAVTQAKQVVSSFTSQGDAGAAVEAAIPSKQDIAGALAQIYGIAEGNGVAVQAVTIGAPIIQAKSQPTAVAAAKATSSLASAVIRPLGTFLIQVTG